MGGLRCGWDVSLGVCHRSPGLGAALGSVVWKVGWRVSGWFQAGFLPATDLFVHYFFTSYEQLFGVGFGFAGGICHLVPDECYQLAGRQWF